MSRKMLTSGRRVFLLSLSFLLVFLSYKPATALLSIAGAAQNPTEGGRSGQTSELRSRENMPRPAKKQQRAAQGRMVQKASRARTVSDEEKTLLRILMQGLQPGLLRVASDDVESAESETSKPEYLRLFLPGTPGSPHSPPA
jgi:hypothetical protein